MMGYAHQHTPQRSAPLNGWHIFEKVVQKIKIFFYIGKFADLIIIDREPFVTPAEKFGGITVLLTIAGGSVVWQDEKHLKR